MATSASDPSARNDIELPPVTNWPLIRVAAILGGIVLAGLVGVVLLAATQTAPPEPVEAVAAMQPAPPPRSADQVVVKPAAPVETVAPSSEPVLWKPLAPAPARLAPITAPIPRGVLTPEPILAPETKQEPPAKVATKEAWRSDSEQLADLLARVQEIDLNAVEGTTAKLLAKSDDDVRKKENVVDLIARRSDLAGLPVRGKSECTLSSAAAEPLDDISTDFHRFLATLDLPNKNRSDSASSEAMYARDQRVVEWLAEQKTYSDDNYAPGLAQMLCVESVPARLQLTKMLAACKGRNASAALAREALFDLAPPVREAAVKALKDRPHKEYQQTLLDGFRHPWPPIADHAAAALTALDDRAAATPLSKLLGLPDPAAPALNDKKTWVKAEVVKVNHLRNCLLCHAPSSSPDDPVRGFIPVPGKEIPVAYYAGSKGDFVRADVTYLKQDFSVMEVVADPNKWPSMQRYDYLVRRRELTEQEIIHMADTGPQPAHSYPQQDAVRFALEKLSSPETVVKPGLGP